MSHDPSEAGLAAVRSTTTPISERSLLSEFVDWLLRLKDVEIARFLGAEGSWDAENVSAWEHREYFGQY